jgi:hypothetical protein
MPIVLYLASLIIFLPAYSMETDENQTISQEEISQLQISQQNKSDVSDCIFGWQGCERLANQKKLMEKIHVQNPQIAAGIYLRRQQAQELKKQKDLVNAYWLNKKECFEKQSPMACKFLIEHQKEILAAKISTPDEIKKAEKTVSHRQCPFFSE